MHTKKLRLENLDCAACALALEKEIGKIDGIGSVSVDFMKQSMTLSYETEGALGDAIAAANRFENVKVADGNPRAERDLKKFLPDIVCIALAAVLLAIAFFLPEAPLAPRVASYVLYALAYLCVGWKVLWETVKNVAHGRIFDENFLMTIASVGAACLMQFSEAVLVMLLYSLGELLQGIAVGSSRKSIAGLMDLKSESATLIRNGEKVVVAPEEIKAGDLMLVKAGEKIAVDGVIVKGKTSLDTKSLSGESAYRDVAEGDEVLGGSINVSGVVEVRAQKEYSESTVAKILDLVENSAAGKAKSEKFITKFARIYTPTVCIAALVVAFVVPLFVGGSYVAALSDWVYRALSFLVISCPCALVISVPLSYFSGIGFAAKYGILLKGSTGLDSLAKTSIAAFDKTGTLTRGNFILSGVTGEEKELALQVAAALEKNSAHPLARAFDAVPTELTAEEVQEMPGLGLAGRIGGEQALAGNAKLMQKYSVSVGETPSAGTLVYVALGGKYLGCAEIGDEIKENAKDSLEKLKALGIRRTAMLTGDSRARAEHVAASVGIGEVYAELLPDQKLEIAARLRREGTLLYAGDGINDAPVLMEADIGVSMGGVGSDAAIEASDAVLMRDDLSLLPLAVRIAKRTRKIVIQNIVFAIAVKVAVMALGLMNLVPLWLAVFADVGVMMLAVLNSFRTRLRFPEQRAKGVECRCGQCGHEHGRPVADHKKEDR